MINKKGLAKGIAKVSMLVLVTAMLGVFLVNYTIPAFADHSSDSNVITPGYEACNVLNDYTLTVTQTGGPDPIYNVRVYNRTLQNTFPDQEGFSCGAAPTGWLYKGFFTIGGESYCEYETTKDPGNVDTIAFEESLDFTFSIKITQESVHPFRVSTIDTQVPVGFQYFSFPNITVDCTPPLTSKDFIGPKKIDGNVEWIDGVTLVNLTGVDRPPHPSGVAETKYVNILAESFVEQYQLKCDPEFPCEDWNYCQSLLGYANDIPEGWWQLYENPFQKEGESCHVLFYYSVDNVGNVEDVKVNCFFVDTTPPEVFKDNGEAIPGTGEQVFMTGENPDGDFHWLTTSMPIVFDCVDPVPHPSGDEELCFRVSFDYPSWNYGKTTEYCSYYGGTYNKYGDEFCCVDVSGEAEFDFYFQEESMHNLEYYCIDAVEKDSCIHTQFYKVDDTPPSIYKEMIGVDHLGDCPPPNDHGDCYVRDDGENGVRIDVEDGGEVCAVDDMDCYYELWWNYGDKIIQCPGPIEDGWCMVDYGEFSESAEVIFYEDSTHELYIYCADALGNLVEHEETFLVDSTPPLTEKKYGEPFVEDWYPKGCYEDWEGECAGNPECIARHCSWAEWITSSTSITLTAEDEKVGVYETYWRNTLVDDEFCEDIDNCYCESPEEEEVFDLTGDVDGTVTKTDNGDSFTWTIVITSPNPPHNVWGAGMAFATSTDQPAFQVWYREYEKPYGWYYQEYTGTGWHGWGGDVIPLPTEGITATGDHTGQTFTITVPKTKLGAPCGRFYWGAQARTNLLGKYPSTWAQWSGGPGEVSGMAISPLGGMGEWNVYTEPFYKPEESCHVIEYFSVDELGNEEDVNWQCVFVDNTEPDVCKDIGEPKVPSQQEGVYYISGQTPIDLYCADMDPHPVDHVSLWYRYRISDDCQTWGDWTDWEDPVNGVNGANGGECDYMLQNPYAVKKTIYFPEDSCHELEYYCVDALGNVGFTQSEIDIVDNKEPVIVKDVIGPQMDCPDYTGELDCYQIDGVTNITVDAYDQQPHPVEGVWCEWGYWWNKVYYGPYYEDTFPFMISGLDESRHDLDIHCEDALGNSVEDVEVFIVDKTPPETEKWYDEPIYIGTPTKEEFQTIGGGTAEWSGVETHSDPYSARLYVLNGGSDIAAVEFDVDIALEDITELSFWQKIANTYGVNVILGIDADGDGVYEAQDKPWHFSHDPADLGDDSFIEMDGMPQSSGSWEEVDTLTLSQWWTPNNAGDGFCTGFGWNPLSDFQTSTACRVEPTDHVKVIRLLIGGSGTWMNKVAFVDDVTLNGKTITFIGPEWITSETGVWLDATDDIGPHDSGVAATWYRDVYLPDSEDWDYCYDACADWENDQRYSAYGLPTAPEPYNPKSVDDRWTKWAGVPFHKEPESCHIIEYYSVDGVDKVERPKWQCVFVDNSAPDPVKTVDDPKTKWDGQDANFYDIAHRCWNETSEDYLECWKVTLFTPITLDCVDPEPHPVDHETVCFNVDFDGDDITADYCEDFNGDMEDRFCCVDEGAPLEFYFGEESEHNLEYYCVDALGNEGDIDEEKFKVEGTTFEIELNKKWNLISVPFVMLDDSIEEVFKNIEEDIKYVWTYDAKIDEWYVYVPGDGGTLTEMVPGWGYWVKALEDTELVIGGSLFSPAKTPPDKELVHGWNLIGYYGIEDMDGNQINEYNGPDGDGKPAYCALFSLIDTQIGHPRFSSLVTYWEPYNTDGDPDTRLWQYMDLTDSMDPGAGYWIGMDVNDTYEFASICGLGDIIYDII